MVLPQAAKFMNTLEKTERLPADELRAYQLELLTRTLAHARDHVAAQKERLAPLFDSGGNLKSDRFLELAPMTKDMLRSGGQDWFAHDTPEYLKPLAWNATSGTTSEPVLVAMTKLAQMVSGVLNERQTRWHGFDTGKRHGMIRHFAKGEADYPAGIQSQGWSIVDSSGRLMQITVHTPFDRLMSWITDSQIHYLTTYPSVAAELAAMADGFVLDAVLTFGEPLSIEQRTQITKGFSCPVVDAYTANETGFIAINCPESEAYHIQSETIFVEIVDAAGKPVRPEERGSVLVTPFYNTVMPLIRYELGDYAELLDEPCPCGRTLPRLKTVAGRGRQIFRYPDGSTRWPNIDTQELYKLIALSQFQVVQVSPDAIEFKYVAKTPDKPFDQAALAALIRKDLYPDLTVKFVPVKDVERTETGKLERYVSRVT